MDCDRIPAPDLWEDETPLNLKEYHLHIQFCSSCRERVLKEAPEKLLFDLSEDSLPEEFWLGFWDSVDRKRTQPQRRREAEKIYNSSTRRLPGRALFFLRWVAVVIFGTFIILYSQTFPQTTRVPQLALLKPGMLPAAEVSIQLMMATKSDQTVAKQIKYIGNTGDATRFYNYGLVGDGVITSTEGNRTGLYLGREYQVRFVTDTIQQKDGIIRLKNFELRKVRKGRGGKDSAAPLISTTLDLRNSETVVLGASKIDEEDQALLVILIGKVKK